MIVFCTVAKSQSDTAEKKNSFKAGVQYISNQTYLGRTDSLQLPVITPSVNFTIHGGFYIKASGYFNLSKNHKGFDGVSIEPGWEFSKNNLSGSISVDKNFISDSSNLIIAPVKASAEFYLGYETKIVTPFIGSGYLFSKEGNDYFVYGGISRSVTLTKADKEPSVSIEPSFSLSGGTQQFYYSFLKTYAANGRGKGRGRNSGSGSVPVTQTIEEQSKKFALLSAAFEMPITFTENKIEFKIDPAWESPLNLVDNNGAGAQQSKSYFYITVELNYSF